MQPAPHAAAEYDKPRMSQFVLATRRQSMRSRTNAVEGATDARQTCDIHSFVFPFRYFTLPPGKLYAVSAPYATCLQSCTFAVRYYAPPLIGGALSDAFV